MTLERGLHSGDHGGSDVRRAVGLDFLAGGLVVKGGGGSGGRSGSRCRSCGRGRLDGRGEASVEAGGRRNVGVGRRRLLRCGGRQGQFPRRKQDNVNRGED